MKTTTQGTSRLVAIALATLFAAPAAEAQTQDRQQDADQHIKPSKEGRGKGSDWAGQKVEHGAGTECQHKGTGKDDCAPRSQNPGNKADSAKAKPNR